MTFKFEGPVDLREYKCAPRSKGLYVIGTKFDPCKPMLPEFEDDPYLYWCPLNFQARYVGISLSNGSGIRGRLSKHARSKGNKGIGDLIRSGNSLWFLYIEGEDTAKLESTFLLLRQKGHLDCNVRPEITRNALREHRGIRNGMTPAARDFYDDLDMGPHGNGM